MAWGKFDFHTEHDLVAQFEREGPDAARRLRILELKHGLAPAFRRDGEVGN